ncbi:GntR family transcriptional regulator [Pseudonocardia sp. N23]|uniref:GntR family transcriptional regulator n=1 Tax=Pseudonocardia sp. N23 TaxID=1987376 RepID=UPI000C025342|nr:GntR family transcriptional regulator [Pseudonocardia sp. N23]GAY09445.1 transcriptional regulator, GntR family [Pseudonocardia sp. N23]
MASREPAAERAYAATKELVLSGDLPGGHLLSEGDIAERLGMSRTPVREAFLRLQSEELLELIPKRGAVVVPVSVGEADDVLDAREAVETAAVRRLLRRPADVPAAVVALRAALDTQRRHAARDDLPGVAAADEAFHRTIVDAGGNRLTARFYASLGDRQRRMSIRALAPKPEQVAVVLDEHAALVGAIEALDGDRFAALLPAHLDGTHRPVR